MRNIELKIDGEIIVLTTLQTAQLKRAIEKETSVPAPKLCGNFTVSCKAAGKESSYPLMITTVHKTPVNWGRPDGNYGKDFNLAELKTFIKNVKEYAALIWATAEKELKNV